MTLLIILGIMFLIGMIPLGIRGQYDKRGAYLFLLIGPFSLILYPGKKQKSEIKSCAKKTKKSEKSKQENGGVSNFMVVLRVILDILQDLRRKLRVKNLYLHVVLAGGDPCDLSVNYGRAWAAIGNLMPQLDRVLLIKNRDIQVDCDFEADRTVIQSSIDLTLTIGRLLGLVCCHGVRFLREYSKVINNAKDGAVS